MAATPLHNDQDFPVDLDDPFLQAQRNRVVPKLRKLILEILTQYEACLRAQRETWPRLPGTTISVQLSNRVTYIGTLGRHTVKFQPNRDKSGMREILMILKIASIAHEKNLKGQYVYRRNVWYSNLRLFETEETAYWAIDTVAATIGEDIEALNIVPSPNGIIFGRGLTFIFVRGKRLSTNDIQPIYVPTWGVVDVELETDVTHAVYLEKECMMPGLIQNNAHEICGKKSLIISGSGYADYAVRRLLSSLDAKGLPIITIVDMNPNGVAIAATCRLGGKRFQVDPTKYQVPNLEWLGVKPTHIERFGISDDYKKAMSDRDRTMLTTLSGRVPEDWKPDLDAMREGGVNVEMDVLGLEDSTGQIPLMILLEERVRALPVQQE